MRAYFFAVVIVVLVLVVVVVVVVGCFLKFFRGGSVFVLCFVVLH